MDNPAFDRPDEKDINWPKESVDPVVVSETARRRFPHEKRVGMAEAMMELQDRIGPDAFCAPLNQGELTTADKVKLATMIIFPCFFFILGIILTDALK